MRILELEKPDFFIFCPQIGYIFCVKMGQIYAKRNARPKFNANNAKRNALTPGDDKEILKILAEIAFNEDNENGIESDNSIEI